jgi:hypothetical protein
MASTGAGTPPSHQEVQLALGRVTRWLMACCAALLCAAAAVTALTDAARTEIWVPLTAVLGAGALVGLGAGAVSLGTQIEIRSHATSASAVRRACERLGARLRTVRWVLVGAVALASGAAVVLVRPVGQVALGVVFAAGVVSQVWLVLAHCYRLVKAATPTT